MISGLPRAAISVPSGVGIPLLGRSGPNLKPGTMRLYVTNGPRNGLNIGRKVGPCPGSRRRWVLGNVHAFSQAAHAANTYRPRFRLGPDRPTHFFVCPLQVIKPRAAISDNLGFGGHNAALVFKAYE